MRIFVVIALFVACAVNVASQQVSSQTRAQAIAAAFSKQKHGVKEKYGVRTEKFKDVRSEPVVKQNVREYAGTYEMADFSLVIDVQVGIDGRVQATWYKRGQQSRTVKLENAKIEGALLTAFKVFEDGTSENFEGVFLNRTVRNSPNAPGVTTFGIGVVLNRPFEVNGLTYDKLFFELKQ